MSASSFSYDVNVTPSPVSVPFDLTVNNNNISVTIRSGSLDNIDFTLTPTGDFGEQILSEIIQPIIETAASDLKSQALEGVSGDIGSISIPSYEAEGVSITPANIALTTFFVGNSNMLKINGSLTLKPSS